MSVWLSTVLPEGLYGLLQRADKYHKCVTSLTKNVRQMKSSSAVFRENIEACASISVTILWGASSLMVGEDVILGIKEYTSLV